MSQRQQLSHGAAGHSSRQAADRCDGSLMQALCVEPMATEIPKLSVAAGADLIEYFKGADSPAKAKVRFNALLIAAPLTHCFFVHNNEPG